jgi:hypothetical protein
MNRWLQPRYLRSEISKEKFIGTPDKFGGDAPELAI